MKNKQFLTALVLLIPLLLLAEDKPKIPNRTLTPYFTEKGDENLRGTAGSNERYLEKIKNAFSQGRSDEALKLVKLELANQMNHGVDKEYFKNLISEAAKHLNSSEMQEQVNQSLDMTYQGDSSSKGKRIDNSIDNNMASAKLLRENGIVFDKHIICSVIKYVHPPAGDKVAKIQLLQELNKHKNLYSVECNDPIMTEDLNLEARVSSAIDLLKEEGITAEDLNIKPKLFTDTNRVNNQNMFSGEVTLSKNILFSFEGEESKYLASMTYSKKGCEGKDIMARAKELLLKRESGITNCDPSQNNFIVDIEDRCRVVLSAQKLLDLQYAFIRSQNLDIEKLFASNAVENLTVTEL